MRPLALVVPFCLSTVALGARTVIHVVVDDLGKSDLGFRNNMTHTPTLDRMAREGVVLDAHYVFQVCAPSRASFLTGRYPWGIGFYYVGGDNLGVPLRYEMLPQQLRRLAKAQAGADIATHAIGKWHNGAQLKAYTPTHRGFETYFGYYHAAVASYWHHGGEGGGCQGTDLSNSTGLNGEVRGADRPDINGTYTTNAFTAEAERLIAAHDVSRPMYMYLAYEAVHDTGGKANPPFTASLEAPLPEVNRHAARVLNDTYKVMTGMLGSLDDGIANVSAALQAKGMLDEAVFIVTADNGGPLDHSYNWPLRGGKHTVWEGGIRGEALVWSPSDDVLPAAARGSTWEGLAHSSDWQPTIIEGLFGLKLDGTEGVAGSDGAAPVRPMDGVNVWPALSTGGTSPRTEVITQLSNGYFDTTKEGDGGMAIRVGDLKLLVGYPGDERWQEPIPLADADVPFGLTGGVIEKDSGGGHDHAGAPGFGKSGAKPQSTLCGGKLAQRLEDGFCLFNVSSDKEERHDLAAEPSYRAAAAAMLAKLVAAAATAGPQAKIYNNSKVMDAAICAVMQQNGGYVEPADTFAPFPPPPTPPTPAPPTPPTPAPPIPAACEKALKEGCPGPFKTPDACLECTRELPSIDDKCKPKQRHAFCGN
jgi:arylsulfatase B